MHPTAATSWRSAAAGDARTLGGLKKGRRGMRRAALTVLVAVIAGAAAASVTVLGAATPLAQQSVPPLSYALADIQVEMHRLGCLGRCPVYTVVLKGDGSGWYDGAK